MEGEREKHQCVVASRKPPTGDLARVTGMCPDWESNWQPFSSQTSAQSTEPHWPGLGHTLFDSIGRLGKSLKSIVWFGCMNE